MRHLLLAMFLLLLPSSSTPGCFRGYTTRLIQKPWSDPVHHSRLLRCNTVHVKACGPRAQQIACTNVSIQRCCLHPCSGDKTVINISPFLRTEVCRQKTIFYWRAYRQASTFNPELALQCLSDPPEEFKAGCIFHKFKLVVCRC